MNKFGKIVDREIEPLKNIPDSFFEKSLNQIKRDYKRQKDILTKYLAFDHEKKIPTYLFMNDIIKSHLERCKQRIENYDDAPYHWAYTCKLVTEDELKTKNIVLSTMLALNLGKMLSCSIDISVTADFFAAMVRTVDDYLDEENTFEKFGEKLLIISHSYMDLMDMALEVSLSGHPDSLIYRGKIYKKILELEKSLIRSEFELDPDKIISYKSSGGALIDVFASISPQNEQDIIKYRNFGQVIGEAFQIMDDTIDYYDDLKVKEKNKNYLHLRGLKAIDGIEYADKKIDLAINIAHKLSNNEALGLAYLSKQFNKVISSVVSKGQRMTLSNFYRVFPLPFLLMLQIACEDAGKNIGRGLGW